MPWYLPCPGTKATSALSRGHCQGCAGGCWRGRGLCAATHLHPEQRGAVAHLCPAYSAQDGQTDRWTGPASQNLLVPQAAKAAGGLVLCKGQNGKLSLTAHFGHHVERWERGDGVKHSLVYSHHHPPNKCPCPPLFQGLCCPPGSAPPGSAPPGSASPGGILHPRGAVPRPCPAAPPPQTGRYALCFSSTRSPTGANYNS